MIASGDDLFHVLGDYQGETSKTVRDEMVRDMNDKMPDYMKATAKYFTEGDMTDYMNRICKYGQPGDELSLWLVAQQKHMHIGVITGRVEGDWFTTEGLSLGVLVTFCLCEWKEI